MIQQEGYLTLIRRNSGTLTNADFDRAKKEGCLKELIESCDLDHVHGPQKNLICHPWAGSLFPRLFYSANVGWQWWYEPSAYWCFLMAAVLTSIDSEPAVTDQNPSANPYYYDSFATKVNQWGYGSVYVSHKFFEEQQAEADEIKSSPVGREDIYYRERWLWAPSDFTSSNIRSFALITGYSGNGGTDEGGIQGKGGHIRLKDANGLPIIYSKTANQILLAEYKFILASV
jgi:hypothetical protein